MANFCSNCGAQLDGAKKFCTSCGQPVTQAAAPAQPAQAAQPQQHQYVQQPVYQPVYQSQAPAKKKSKAPVIIVIVVVIIALAAVYFTNGFGLLGGGNPTGGNNNSTSAPSGGNSPGTSQNGGNNSTSAPAKETKVGDVIKFGDYNWYVIDVDLLNKKALIITDKVIGNRAWHDTDMGNDAKVTWADCDLRAYLNGEFYKSLPEDFKSKIVEVVNKNPENERERPSERDPATNDKVFLLSVNEAVRYIEIEALTVEGNGHLWWLRSPGMEGLYAAGVAGGESSEVYAGGYYATTEDIGIRPVLWISLSTKDS